MRDHRAESKARAKRKGTERMREWLTRPGNRERANTSRRRRYAASPEFRVKERQKQRRRYGVPTRPEPAFCEICGEPETFRGGQALAQDHDHVTGLFRGWLCRRCNLTLGAFRDSVALFRSAIKYLEKACNPGAAHVK
jgi:hypothetical protein